MQSDTKKKIIYFSGLGSTFILILFIVAGLPLNDEFSKFIHEYSLVFLLIFIILITFLVHDVLVSLVLNIKYSFYKKRHLRELEEKLTKLSASEKYILSLFVTERKVEQSLDQNEPAVAWLESIKIIFNTGKSVDGKHHIYKISPLPMRILSSNPNWLY